MLNLGERGSEVVGDMTARERQRYLNERQYLGLTEAAVEVVVTMMID